MRRLFLFLFILHLGSGGCFLTEVAKLPALVLHYKAHQQMERRTSFVEFMWLHYGNSAHGQENSSEHQSLPFHTHAHLGAASAYSLPESLSEFNLASSIWREEALAAANFYYHHYLPVGFCGRVFQPPKA